MKICWDNLEGVKITKKGNFRKNGNTYKSVNCAYCSSECLTESRNRSVSRLIFCDSSCSIKFYEPRKLVIDTNRKGKIPWNKGKTGIFSKEVLKQMSEKRVGVNTGEDHYNYNHNLTDDERVIKRNYKEYTDWRKAVYDRDSYTCRCCDDSSGGNLNAHHIESYNNNPELRTTLSNGVTLCTLCHKNFHHQYGYGNNTKEQLYNFLLEQKGERL